MKAKRAQQPLRVWPESEEGGVPPPVNGYRPGSVPQFRILRTAEVLLLTGLSRTTIWRLERNGDFPRRRRLSTNAVGWVVSEVEEWVRSRVTIS